MFPHLPKKHTPSPAKSINIPYSRYQNFRFDILVWWYYLCSNKQKQ